MSTPQAVTATLWELPDVLLFRIVGFVAAPSHRAAVLCHQLAPLCRASHQNLLRSQQERALLWDAVLSEDYGVVDDEQQHALHRKKRRKCERLSRTPVQRVRDAHLLMNTNTEIAFFYLTELVHCRTANERLSKARMVRIFSDYGPRLRINRTASTGGTFLVEVCRARDVTERTVLHCLRELVENRGALVDSRTSESARSHQTALSVAAARGMPTVTRYLLKAGADPDVRSSGRFALHTNKKQSLRCDDATVAEFVQAMINAEKAAGASKAALQGLTKCLRLLENHHHSPKRRVAS